MRLILVITGLLLAGCAGAFEVPRANVAPIIDGDPSDAAWLGASWREIDQIAIGPTLARDDFNGRYKLVWTQEHLYLLAEISDDVLIDTHADPLHNYWDDDTLEIFIDEDLSRDIHLENFSAFAYHIALDNQVVDIAPGDETAEARLFPNHLTSAWRRGSGADNRLYWEVQITVHNKTHTYGDDTSSRVMLKTGKRMGFMVAYCDADNAEGRQHFIGDVEIKPVNGDRNRGYIDAGVFGEIALVESKQ